MSNPLVSTLGPLLWQELYGPTGLVRSQIGTFPPPGVQPASATPYTPAAPGNWTPTPSQVAAALDQLAAPAVYQNINAGALSGTPTAQMFAAPLQRRKSGLFCCIASLTGTSGAAAPQAVTGTLYIADNGPRASVFVAQVAVVSDGAATRWATTLVGVVQATQAANLIWSVDITLGVPSTVTIPVQRGNIVIAEF